jgi:hypothetical protein
MYAMVIDTFLITAVSYDRKLQIIFAHGAFS